VNRQVAEALRKLYVGKRTGVLLAEGEEAKRSAILKSGSLVGARSSVIEDRLGEVMMRHGKITRQQFEEAARHIKSGLKVGEILTKLRFVHKNDIEAFVRIQVLDIACSLLLTPPARMVFTDMETVDETVAQPVSVADAIMEAARRSAQVSRRLEELLSIDRPLSLAQDPDLRHQDVDLNGEERFILSRIDGSHSAAGIAALSPLSEKETARVLLGLMEAGIVQAEGQPAPKAAPFSYAESGEEVEQAPPPAAPPAAGAPKSSDEVVDAETSAKQEIERLYEQYEREDHWQVLGIERESTQEEIASAFREKSLLYHPDGYRHIEDQGFQEKLSHVFHRLNEAHQTLSGKAQAQGYEELTKKEHQYEKENKEWSAPPQEKGAAPAPVRDEKEGKALFAQAKNAYLKCDYWRTIQFCQQAIEIISDQAEIYHLLAVAQKENPKWRKDAERNLQIAIKLDPWKPEYLVALGKLYQEAGLGTRAAKAFEQVRALDPSFPIPE
jgi:hypothetical protein